MATSEELAARYADLLDDAGAEDRELMETLRALDALFAVEVPADLGMRAAALTQRRAAERAGAGTRLVRREVAPMRGMRTLASKRWTGVAASAVACVVVGLLAVLLISGHGGGGGVIGGNATPLTGAGELRITAAVGCQFGTGSGSCRPSAQALASDGNILYHRITDAVGAKNVQIRVASPSELTVEVPGITNASDVLPLFSQGNFAILDTGAVALPVGTRVGGDGTTYRTVFTGTQVDPNSVQVQSDRQTGQTVLTFAFAGSARQAFAQYTQQHIGSYLTVTLDDTVVESATIQSAIDGAGQIVGFASVAEARQMMVALKYGPLAAPFQELTVTVVAPGGASGCTPSTPATVNSSGSPVSTPTEPPNAPPPAPTFTPWPGATPSAAGGETPTGTAAAGGPLTPPIPAVVIICGTRTANGIATQTVAPANGTPTLLPAPTTLPVVTPTR